MGNTLLPRVSG